MELNQRLMTDSTSESAVYPFLLAIVESYRG